MSPAWDEFKATGSEPKASEPGCLVITAYFEAPIARAISMQQQGERAWAIPIHPNEFLCIKSRGWPQNFPESLDERLLCNQRMWRLLNQASLSLV